MKSPADIPLPLRTGPYYVAPVSRAYAHSALEENWAPLTSSRVSVIKGEMVLSGDVRGKFTELTFLRPENFDYDGPIWVREHTDAPGVFEVAALQ